MTPLSIIQWKTFFKIKRHGSLGVHTPKDLEVTLGCIEQLMRLVLLLNSSNFIIPIEPRYLTIALFIQ